MEPGETWEQFLAHRDLMVTENDFADALQAEREAYRRVLERNDLILESYSQWGVTRRVPYSQLRHEAHRMDELFKQLGFKPVVDDWQKRADAILKKRIVKPTLPTQRRKKKGIEM